MAKIVLHGDLAQFGGPYEIFVKTPGEAIRALSVQIKGFRRRIGQGQFRVVRRSGAGLERELDAQTLGFRLRNSHELHITPVVAGSMGRGTTKIILGAALVAAAVAFAPAAAAGAGFLGAEMGATVGFMGITYGGIAGLGLSMALGGAAQMLSPQVKGSSGTATSQDRRESFLFSGPINVTQQGVAKPLVFGRFICGSVVISSSLSAESI